MKSQIINKTKKKLKKFNYEMLINWENKKT